MKQTSFLALPCNAAKPERPGIGRVIEFRTPRFERDGTELWGYKCHSNKNTDDHRTLSSIILSALYY